jgi:hypothetical protein
VQDVLIATPDQPQASLLRHHGTWLRENLGTSNGNVVLNGDTAEMRPMYEITDAQAALLSQADTRVTVHASVVEHEMRALLDMPAVSDKLEANDGHRVRIVRMERTREPVLVVRHSSVPVDDHAVTRPLSSHLATRLVDRLSTGRFELVNPERREAIVLTAAYDRNTEMAAVLPASHARATYITLSQRDGGRNMFRPINPNDSWMSGARLRFVVPVAASTYTVSATGPVTRIAEVRR